MGVNFVALCVGLIICFGGIYLKKLCAAILGFIWGIFAGFMLVLLAAGSLYRMDESSLAIVLVIAVVVALVCMIFDRLCAMINAFLSTFFIVMIVLSMIKTYVEVSVAILIAVVSAFIVAAIALWIHDYAFILITAFSGAFIANLGGFGLLSGAEFSDMLSIVLRRNQEEAVVIWIGTLILGVLGCCVQAQRLKHAGTNITHRFSQKEPGIRESQAVHENAPTDWSWLSDIVNTFGRKIGSALNSAGEQIKNMCGELSTAEGWNDLGRTIKKEIFLLIAPCIAYLLIGLYWGLGISEIGIFYRIIHGIYSIADAVAIASLVYIFLVKDLKFNLFYLMFCVLTNVITGFGDFFQWFHISMVSALTTVIIWILFCCVMVFVTRDSKKPFVLTVTAILADTYLIPRLAFGRFFGFHLRSLIVTGVLMLATVFLMFWIKENFNIFSLFRSTGQEDFTQRSIHCPRCGNKIDRTSNFCANCGQQIDWEHKK